MAAAGSNTYTTLNALFKEVYADKVENLQPENTKLIQRIPFSKRSALGNLYHQPVILGMEQGVTYAGPTDDAFDLDDAIPGAVKDAQIQGSQMMLRSRLGVAAASRASNGDKSSFESATKFLVRNMLRSLAKRLEVGMLYGGVGIGTVGSVSTNNLTITTAEWAPGIWVGAETMKIEVYDATLATNRGAASITAVNMTTRVITVDAAPVGTVATDVLFYKSAKGNEAVGFHKIITNTGTLFNISAASYSLWKGNTLNISSNPLSFARVQEAISLAVEKGLDSAVVVLVNPRGWSDLLTEQAALRMYDSSYSVSVAENGSQEIVFFAQNGKVEIIPHIYVKEGYAYVLHLEECERIGSTDITFNRPDAEGKFFRDLDNAAGYELRAYSDQALFCYSPGKNVLISGIVN